MSVRTLSATSTSGGQKDLPVVYSNPQSLSVTPYTRPSDWLTLPTVLATDQKIVLLVAVTNDTSNFMALACTTSSGTYTVDWGDGSSPSVVASNTTVYKNYNWSDISSSTLTSKGYRQAIVTITPTTANLTGFNMNLTYSSGGVTTASGWANKVLEAVVAGSNITSINFGGSTQRSVWMEQANILSLASNVSLSSVFFNCYKLANVVSIPNTNTTTTSAMFQNCYQLQTVPLFNTSSVTTMSSMFNGCYSLISVPTFVTTSVTDMSSMFGGCYALPTVPFFNTSAVTTMNSMFSNCQNLTSVAPYNTANVTDMANMFQNCFVLKSVPTFNTIKVTTVANMFNGCQNLIVAPPFNLIACTTLTAMYSGCQALVSAPAYNLPVATTLQQMFLNCYALKTIGTLTTSSSLTNMSQVFTQCRSLINAPTITNTTNVTNMTELFYFCYSLQSVPLYDMGNITSMSGMFTSTYSLRSVPTFNTAKVTAMDRIFQASGIVSVPTFNTSNVTTLVTAFYQANAVTTLPVWDTSKVTTMQAAIQQTPSLKSVPAWNTSNCANFLNFATSSGINYFDSTLDLSKATNINGMLQTCNNLGTIPAFNLTNVTTSGTPFASMPALTSANITNLKITSSFASSNMNKAALESLFGNGILPVATTQTITITGAPGADTALSKTATWTNTSNVVTMANTVGVVVGAQVTGANMANTVSATAYSNSKISTTNLIDNNNMVAFATVTTSNLAANTLYWVSNQSNVSGTYYYDLATSNGGTPITFTAGTMTMNINRIVTAVNTNANITLSAFPSNSGTGATVTTRILNTNIAAFKNWTVTG